MAYDNGPLKTIEGLLRELIKDSEGHRDQHLDNYTLSAHYQAKTEAYETVLQMVQCIDAYYEGI